MKNDDWDWIPSALLLLVMVLLLVYTMYVGIALFSGPRLYYP